MIHPNTELRFVNNDIGSGVFATRLIPRGTIVWIRCDFDRIYSPWEVEAMAPPYRDLVHKFSYVNSAGDLVLAWDLARYVKPLLPPGHALCELRHRHRGSRYPAGRGTDLRVRILGHK